jgi:hypothetical protein
VSSRPSRRQRRRVTPGPSTLLALYPPAWRRRYGDELDALILDIQADGRDTGWRVRADLVRSAARERLRGGGDPSRRVRGGSSLVLWAWALFALGGAIVAKTSEHWQRTLPADSAASAAFSGLVVISVAVAAVITGGITVTLPAIWRLLRAGGWPRIRARVLCATALTVTVVAATAGLVAWAGRLSPAGRNGHDHLYVAAFLCWAALSATCLLAWTAVGARTATEIRCGRAVLRTHTCIAGMVAIAMAAMTAATLAWWTIVGNRAPGALTGGSALAHPSALVPQLMFAAALMVLATAIAAVGAIRAERAFTELSRFVTRG